jgi:GNAT superfamily N-acetyltransferase
MMANALVLVPTPGSERPAYPWHLIEQWALRDGTPVTIRPIRAADLLLERAFVVGLSPSTRYQRLLSARKLMPGELKRLTDIDYRREMALVAIATIDGVTQELGVARYVRDDEQEPGSADFAIVVADRWQGRGLGKKLMRSLLNAAVKDGIKVVGGITLSTNAGMIALARKLGFTTRLEHGNATVTDLRWEAAPFDPSAFVPSSGWDALLPLGQRGASGGAS